MNTKLYYTMTEDFYCTDNSKQNIVHTTVPKKITIRNKVDPAKTHHVNVQSIAMRVREAKIENHIGLYTPATNDGGGGLVQGTVAAIYLAYPRLWPTESFAFLSPIMNNQNEVRVCVEALCGL
ncbi:hypothetical protein Y032_0291g1565 [Ancylostoma ceylanicum]|nr:hypothetical protein Y032_0291g1565 [Ancylostoma ceylanicum]